MGMFDYKDYSGAQAAELIILSKQLAVYGSVSGIMGLPTGQIMQGLADTFLSGGTYANPINLQLPAGWQEITPTQLGLPADTLDFYGYYPIESPITGFLPSGPQAKILGQYDQNGKLTQISIVFAGTNSPVDVLDYFQMNENTITPNMEPLLNAVKDFAIANHLSGKDILVTGYSLGGAMTNIMAKNRADLADGFFNDAQYIGHAAPYIYDNPEVVVNMGFENDVVHRVVGNEANVRDAIEAGKPGLVNPDSHFASSYDNVVLFNDAYASPLWDVSLFSILNIPFGWYAHIDGLLTNAETRIANSAFYEYTAPDSTVIVSSLSALSRSTTWVEDKAAPTSDHYGTPAFIIGTQYNDLLKGGLGGDYIDAGAGNDKIKTSAGADRIEGGEGTDTLILEGTRNDWDVYRTQDGTLFFNPHDGSGLKQVSGIEQVTFSNEIFSQSRPYTVEADGLADHRYTIFKGLNKNISYSEAVKGTVGNDHLHGKIVFAGDGNDVLQALDNGSLLHGGTGADILIGGAGNDTLYGAEGNDILLASGGRDIMYGDVGNDQFVFDGSSGQTQIKDFNTYAGDDDRLIFTKEVFASEDALAAAAQQCGSDVMITHGNMSITLHNSTLADVLQHSVLLVA